MGINYAPEPTGIAPYTTGLAEGLARQGDAVRIITGYPHYPWWKIQDGYTGQTIRERTNGVSVTRVRHYVPQTHSTLRRSLVEITYGLRALFTRWGRPDVVIVVSPALLASRAAALKARLLGIPVIMWVQDIYTLGHAQTGGGSLGTRAIGFVEKSLADASSRVVVIHDRFRRFFTQDLGTTSPVDVVRNWSHLDVSSVVPDPDLRRRLGWGDDQVIVLHSGNMGAKQGLENVVHAAREAERRGSRVRFVLLGDGNQREALQAMGPSANLQYVDPLPDGEYERALASADILLVNEREGLTEMSVPSKLTSYFAAGLPVIGAVDPSSITYEEMVSSGAGPCVPAADAVALVDAAEAIAGDPEAAKAYGAAALRFREENQVADAAIRAFDAVIGRVTRS